MHRNQINELLNIKYPIFQGGMAWVSDADLAGAVSNAGGLGIIAAGNAPADWVKSEIEKIRKITSNPFGLNIMMMSPFKDDVCQLAAEMKVPVVITGAGSPGRYLELWKKNNMKIIPVCPSTSFALRMERYGADAIICEGTEAGGHIGQLTTMALVPQVVDAVNIPVVAAGGIADRRGAAAAFMLGASGVQVGTRFLVSKECNAHKNFKEKIIGAKDVHTVVSGLNTGHPVRSIKNSLTNKFKKLEKEGAPMDEFDNVGKGALRKAVVEGDIKTGSLMAGQISGLIKDELSCDEIIKEIIEGAYDLIRSYK
jgi:enoyl-[acyl-carrier protein] reductase II